MQKSRLILASAVLHIALLAILLHARHLSVEPIRLPGTALGSHISLTFSPGRAVQQSTVSALAPAPSRVIPPIKPAATPSPVDKLLTATASPASKNANAAQGGDALGSGNVTVALATFFPTPKPDLPHGTRGDVIVDVTIDEQGKIVDSKVAQSLGQGIDATVLATIQTWTFKPATKDGLPVPSQQELLFHYERG